MPCRKVHSCKHACSCIASTAIASAGKDDGRACPAAGFVSYGEFQSQALGLGAAVSAVTFLFWVAVLLLVSHSMSMPHSI
jgi:hypothetical protein